MPEDHPALARYLAELRAGLDRLSAAEVDEIVAEIRSHVRDAAAPAPGGDGEPVATALERLGPARELAAAYVADGRLARAETRPWPWRLLRALAAWATTSVAGAAAFFLLAGGYAASGSLLLAALLKPVVPDRSGLWRIDAEHYSLHIGLRGAPASGEELLGWWLIPLGVAGGAVGLWLCTAFGRWAIGRLRRPLLGSSR